MFKNFISNHYNLLIITVAFFFVFGISIQAPYNILTSYFLIFTSPQFLTTDYLYIAGFGASLVNASIVTLMAIILLKLIKHKVRSATISNLWLLLGFSLFGKNPLSVLPIWLGGLLFAKLRKQNPNTIILTILIATSLSPVVSLPLNLYFSGYVTNLALAIVLCILKGLIIGFIFEPIATNVFKIHNGYNLYNGGLTAGFIAITITSIYQSFGIYFTPVALFSTDYHNHIIIFLLILSAFYIFIGIYLNPDIKQTLANLKKLNKTKNDYLAKFGTLVYLNMGLLGLTCVALSFLLSTISPNSFLLHGPALGGIISTFGFGANGKNVPSAIPLFIGVIIAALLSSSFHIYSPAIITTMFFVTCLSPVSTILGKHWGIIAAFLHVHIVTSVSYPSGGLNLYNNGLAAGFVVILLYPIIYMIKKL